MRQTVKRRWFHGTVSGMAIWSTGDSVFSRLKAIYRWGIRATSLWVHKIVHTSRALRNFDTVETVQEVSITRGEEFSPPIASKQIDCVFFSLREIAPRTGCESVSKVREFIVSISVKTYFQQPKDPQNKKQWNSEQRQNNKFRLLMTVSAQADYSTWDNDTQWINVQ